MPRALPVVAGLVAAGHAWAALDPGPLPGDVAITRAVQRVLGSEPAWAKHITDTASFPYAWATVALAAALAFLVRGWRAASAAGVAFVLAHGVDELVRHVVHAPRPSVDLIAVASPATAAGLPSTLGLVFGALFGLTLIAARDHPRPWTVALLSAALLVVGFLARVVLGGHWPSQMLLSLALGTLAGALALRLAGPVARSGRKRN